MKMRTALKKIVWRLLNERQISYQWLKLEMDLDDAKLEALRHELIVVRRWAVDRDGEFLVWAGGGPVAEAIPPSSLAPVKRQKTSTLIEAVEDTEPPALTTAKASDSPQSNDAERRPLTVMFCDLADSTELSTKLDPEDLQDVIRAYQEISTKLIQEYEGFVAKYMGDGILVYFGYPKSLERNAERAVRSGLAIVEAMAELNRTLGRDKDVEIAVRIGIATGMVMVGEVVGEGLAQERTVIGEAPNMAARLQGLAGRNGIVIGSLTRDLSGDAFAYEDMGAHELKGISGLVKTWAVTGLRDDSAGDADQNETDDAAIVPELVGRDEETGLLLRGWQSVKDEGRGQVVMISGEAGIGKSVLIDGLSTEVRAEGLPRITMRCSPYHINSALHPVIEHFKRLAGWQPEDEAEARLAKLEAALEPYDQPLGETVPLMASLLSLTMPEDRYPPLGLTPQQQKQHTLDAIVAITLETAERQPLLQLWEDLHWADPSTLELLGLLIEQAPTVSLLMVLTARPEFVPPWPARSHITPITLNRLERPHAEALVARIAGMKPLPDEVIDHVVTKTDGVPLYVEELTKTILASDILRDTGEHFELTGPLSSLSIPETLQESLMARLDRLPQVRELAQLGSVLGREFAYEMISGLTSTGESVLQEGLGQLVDAELLYQRGRPPRSKYMFKHALIQDAAYQSLLKRTRQQYHNAIAEMLTREFPDTFETQPEILAHHFTEADKIEQASSYWLKAGQQALRRSENYEAIGHLKKGLAILPEGGDSAVQELAMLQALGTAYMATKGYAAPETVDTFDRARKLCGIVKDNSIYPVMFGVWLAALVQARHASAKEMIAEMHELAAMTDNSFAPYAAHFMSAITYLHTGDLHDARSHFEKSFALQSTLDPDEKTNNALLYGLDIEIANYAYSAWGEWLSGNPDAAFNLHGKALDALKVSKQGYTQTRGLYWCAVVNQFLGEWDEVARLTEAAIDSATQHGMTMVVAVCRILNIAADAELNGLENQADEIADALAAYRATGACFQVPYHLTLQAQLLLKSNRIDDGLEVIRSAKHIVQETAECYFLPEILRLNGEFLLAGGHGEDKAKRCFAEALKIAEQQGARSLQLRAVVSMGRLLEQQGKPREARKTIKPVFDRFTEGFDTQDLRIASAFLETCAGRSAAE